MEDYRENGEGEWQTRQHGVGKRRTWRQLHLGKDANIHQHGNCQAKPHPRDQNLRRSRKVGRKRWKRESGYHRRSIAETTMFRLKTLFGGMLRSRQFNNQAVELFLQCAALNRMIRLGKPESFKVEG